MDSMKDYLDKAKKIHGIKSDSALAMRIGISQAAINKIRTGLSTPSDEHCRIIAELAAERPDIVIAQAHYIKAQGDNKKIWKHILKAVTAAAFIVLLYIPSFAHAETVTSTSTITVYYVKSIMC